MTNEEYLAVVKDLSTLNMSLKEHPFDEAISELEDKILTNQYRIAVVGDFSTGKSTFINALIGEELLYCSNIEATGVITTIQYGDKPVAHICKKKNNEIVDDGILEEIDLSNDVGRKKLNKYLDIRNELNVDHINIFYPIQGVEKNIVFFDTPGIEKLSKQQVLMTKRIISEVNAVIFLITKKGFTKPSLKVISGEHEIIGKIPSKDIMVVMTHIGEIFDEKKNINPDLQIFKIVNEAKTKLAEKNLGEIDVIPLDSRDYLWGINDRLYLNEKETRDEKLKGPLLEQSVYRERSKFDDFKDVLYKFLDKDNLKRSREQDINSTITLISDAIEQEIKKQYENEDKSKIVLKNHLEKQIEKACENQRKFYNRLMQKLRGHMEDFLVNVEKDAENEKKLKKELIQFINQAFVKLEDINENKVNSCIEKNVQDIEEFAKKIEIETNKHIEITNNYFIRNCFSEQFQKIFEKSVDVKIENETCDLSIIIEKSDYDVSDMINDSDLEELKRKKEKEKQEKSQLEKKLASAIELDKKNRDDYQIKKNMLEDWYNTELTELGNRPKARQKYREETRSKGILFWKKTWTERIPDGMDNSAGIEWDKKQRELIDKYEKECDLLELSSDKIEKNELDIRKYKNNIDKHKSEIKRLDDKIQKYKDYVEEDKRKYTEAYINEKKEEVVSLCEENRIRIINQICEDISKHINGRKKEMGDKVREELKKQIAKYQSELEQKNRIINEKIKVTTETQENALEKIYRIKEIINERAI